MKKENYMWLCFFTAIVLFGLYFIIHYGSLIIDEQEQFKIWTNYGIALTAFGGAFMIYYLSQIENHR